MSRRVIALLLAFVSVFAFISTPTHAATPQQRSLGISPLRSELTITPGTSFDGKLILINSGSEALSVEMTAEVFSVTDEVYDYSFDPSGTGVDWVSFDTPSLSIDPGKVATVNYKVAVPITAEPGGRYLSLFASSRPTDQSSGVTSINRIASLLYITVNGDVSRTGKILTFDSPIVTFGNPAWSATVQNSGSTHFDSPYSVTVKSLFGGSVLKTNTSDSLILPSSVRLITQQIPDPDFIGIYRLDYVIGLGDVTAHKETRWILYLPPIQTLIILVVIAIVVLWLLPRHKKKKTPKE